MCGTAAPRRGRSRAGAGSYHERSGCQDMREALLPRKKIWLYVYQNNMHDDVHSRAGAGSYLKSFVSKALSQKLCLKSFVSKAAAVLLCVLICDFICVLLCVLICVPISVLICVLLCVLICVLISVLIYGKPGETCPRGPPRCSVCSLMICVLLCVLICVLMCPDIRETW